MSLLGSIFKQSSEETFPDLVTPLDLVTHAAGLASNPSDIDPMLDKVRKITATTPDQGVMSASQEATLLDVYLELETYLTTSDPIRTYTKEELRSHIDPPLLAKLTAHEAKGAN